MDAERLDYIIRNTTAELADHPIGIRYENGTYIATTFDIACKLTEITAKGVDASILVVPKTHETSMVGGLDALARLGPTYIGFPESAIDAYLRGGVGLQFVSCKHGGSLTMQYDDVSFGVCAGGIVPSVLRLERFCASVPVEKAIEHTRVLTRTLQRRPRIIGGEPPSLAIVEHDS